MYPERKILGPRTLTLIGLLGLGLATGAFAADVELISQADPVPDSFGTSFSSGMSADGRYVLFQSTAPNLVPNQVDDNGLDDLFLRDRVTGKTLLISHAAGKPNVAGHFVPGSSAASFTFEATISADGRYVAFVSAWTDLLPGPPSQGAFNAFLYDRVAGTTTLISHAAGTPAVPSDGFAIGARISADGNYVAFSCTGANLIAGQTPSAGFNRGNLFLYKRSSGAITLISHRYGAPTTGGNGGSGVFGPMEIDADGGYVAFVSDALDLTPGHATSSGPGSSVYLYERATGSISLISHAAGSPLTFADRGASELQISSDGRWIAFASPAGNLIAGQLPNSPDLAALAGNAFLYDRLAGTLRMVSHTTASPQTPAGTASELAMSADGRYLAFDSLAPDLVPGQVNPAVGYNVFVYDRVADAISLVSHDQSSATTAPPHPDSSGPSISADGPYIAYTSSAADLVPHPTGVPGGYDVFVYDQAARTSVLASHVPTSLTAPGNGGSSSARISADGGAVAFGSYANDLVVGQVDPIGFQGLFLFERKSAEVTALSTRDPDLPTATPDGPSWVADLSADGRIVVFTSDAPGLVPGQVDKPYSPAPEGTGMPDVFLRDRATGKTTLLSRLKTSPPTAGGGSTPVVSADGNFAAFVAGDSNSQSIPLVFQLEVYDRAADALILANHSPGLPDQLDGTPEGAPAISADGRYVAYACSACHLVPGQLDTPRTQGGSLLDVFLFDRVTGTNTLVSHAVDSLVAVGDGDSQAPRISADGRFVAFSSEASDLVANQSGLKFENLFVFDRTTGATGLVSRAAGPAASAGFGAAAAVVSADGRWIAYWSDAVDLVPGQVDTNGVSDLFLYDQATGTTALVSHASLSPVVAGSADQNHSVNNFQAAISADGRWIVFTSQATDLVPGEDNPDQHLAVYLYDRTTAAVSLISSPAGSSNVASLAWQPGISADGSRITFLSPAASLVPGQSASPSLKLFLQEQATGARTLVATVQQETEFPDGRNWTNFNAGFSPRLSSDGHVIAFTSDASLAPGDLNQTSDVFVYDATAQGGPVAVPPCTLFNGALRSNVRKPLTAAGACGVPATAKQVAIKLTVSRGTGQGNVQLFAGSATTAAAGILRFGRGATRGASFNVSLGNGAFSLLPFVAGKNGTVRVSVEIDGYTP